MSEGGEIKSRSRTDLEPGHQRVRVSMRPDDEITVTDAEHLDLESQGLLVASTKKGARLRDRREGK